MRIELEFYCERCEKEMDIVVDPVYIIEGSDKVICKYCFQVLVSLN